MAHGMTALKSHLYWRQEALDEKQLELWDDFNRRVAAGEEFDGREVFTLDEVSWTAASDELEPATRDAIRAERQRSRVQSSSVRGAASGDGSSGK